MVRYGFEQISEADFEALVVDLCSGLLGIGVKSFTKGPDGGKDGFFSGTAQSYPSVVGPWKGDFIIQAKHTTDPNASCSDNDFFNNKSSVLNHEIERLIERRDKNHQAFDCYLVFTNRKLSGGTHTSIVNHLRTKLSIKKADIIGEEELTRYVDNKPELVKRYRLFRYLSPDRFFEKDIRDVIVLFSQNTEWMKATPVADKHPLDYTDKEIKNALNDINDYYFSEIKSHSLPYFRSIEMFLTDPRNREYLQKYENTVSDIRGYIQKNIESHLFMDLLETISENIAGADPTEEIYKVRKLIRVFVHYMYWNCDIGQKE